ncbi:uncharacterized protein LOC127841554 isoform X1 [Dreissena polymorpha]|uniref:uncharacterized protein LOC127841554 isoform X1 n=2 Tax=Dreissena polymorpha TaxID=45954 RepID=UPI002264C618|nr:uncharacterized protein LOC127841554 isoform X1 [Dreissena polymorpha]
MFYDIFVPAVTVLTSPKAERDQVESSLYTDGQLQISFNARIFIINPLNKLVSVSAFVGILPPHFGAASVTVMAGNKRSKQKHTTRKTRKACTTAHNVAGHSTDDKEFSERLSRVLDNQAVNEQLIHFRRKRMLSCERELTLAQQVFAQNRRVYIFGSQIEGTTTMEMMSDTDCLFRCDMFRVFLDSENHPFQLHDHQVVIKLSTNSYAPQYCILTMIEQSIQTRHFKKLDPNRGHVDIVNFFLKDKTTTDGMIPHTIMFDNLDQVKHDKVTRHGPASSIWDTDSVNACYCKSLPKQCKFVFERPRPGHWPSEKTLIKAKKYGVFIVPQGPPKSTNICTNDYFDYQWRISTNLTERLFMFSLDTVRLKAFVLTKMIRKELFVPEYRDGLSTFHFKTAFFFAVENTRPDLWREDNLINCVKYILATLKRFLIRRNCPHFTIENVNLFDGKIERHKFQKLVDIITDVINSLRAKIEHIKMDNIGKTLTELGTRQNEHSRYCTIRSAHFYYVLNIFGESPETFYGDGFLDISVDDRKALFATEISRLEMYYRAPLRKYRKYAYVLHYFMSMMASLFGSAFLEQKEEGHAYFYDGINKARTLFIQSLESDIIGNYMRYASFLFCNGEYDEACKYFDLIEQQIYEDKNKCNLIYQLFVSPSELLALQIAKQSCEQSFKQRRSVFLVLRQAEAMCVPEFLRCEMYRKRFGTPASSGLSQVHSNDDCICVQIKPYLYYLQYLTYKELQQEPYKSKALMKLSMYTNFITSTRLSSSKGGNIFLSHFDTSLNMLGHCLELEQKLESAWKTYVISLKMLPERNAAVLHIIRLLWQVVQSLRT